MILNQILKYSLIFLIATTASSLQGKSEEKAKSVNKSYKVTAETILNIENSFGEIELNNWDKPEFKIDVEIKVVGRNSDRADKLLRSLEVNFSENGNVISFETDVENKMNTKGEESFEVNYTVFLPSENEIDIRNQFGDIYIEKRLGKADIEVKFGNVKTEDFEDELDLTVSFGNAFIGNTMSSDVNIKYGELEMGNGQKIDLEQQFSDVVLGDFSSIRLESKYGEVELGSIDYLDAEVQFSELSIEKIGKEIEIEGNYVSDFEIETLSKDFTVCRFYGKFSEMELNLEEGLKAEIEADMSFCRLKDYSEEINFYFQSKDDNRKEYKGKINGGDDTKRIVIRSSYGDVKIN